jgi:hypothetical protein
MRAGTSIAIEARVSEEVGMYDRARLTFICLSIFLTASAACGSDEDGSSGGGSEPTPAERFCGALESRIDQCGGTECDQALVKDCADVAGVFSDPYLSAAATCLEDGGSLTTCLSDAFGAVKPTDAHRQFAEQFCSKCLLGVPGCEEAFFSPDGGDASLAGKLIVPFGDGLVAELGEKCASGLTCAATFSSCAQQVLVARALPDAVAQCLITSLVSGGDDAGETCNQSASTAGTGSGTGSTSGAGGAGGAGSGTSGTTTGSTTGSGAGGCAAQPSYDACYECCANDKPDAYNALVVHVLNECACQIGSICSAQCAADCGTLAFDQSCIDCVNAAVGANDACVSTGVEECNADAACVPFIDCAVTCPS